MGNTLQGMLEAELEDDLRYSRYDYANKETDNRQNGYSKKTITSSMGDLTINISRDQDGEFKPQVVKKHQTDISTLEDQVLSFRRILTGNRFWFVVWIIQSFSKIPAAYN
ncbi:transposase [Acetobacterium sp.]|uniref:transposase n=1 Tax=Acetobacterium sp. TaxID=1872094 RepID=UPI00359472A4